MEVGPCSMVGIGMGDMTGAQVHEFLRLSSIDSNQANVYIGGVLGLETFKTHPHAEFTLDFFHALLLFVAEIQLTLDQSLLVFNIAKNLFTEFLDGKDIEKLQKIVKTRLFEASIPEPGKNPDTPTLSLILVEQIANFFATTFFQHFMLYKYCFTSSVCAAISKEGELGLLPVAGATGQVQNQTQTAQAPKDILEPKDMPESASEVVPGDGLTKPSIRIGKSQSLEEAIDFLVHEKMELAKKQLLEELASQRGKVEPVVKAGQSEKKGGASPENVNPKKKK